MNASFLSTGHFGNGVHGLESRQKQGGMRDFCLPAGQKLGRAGSKVDKNRGECVIFVYRLVKNWGARVRK
ncbi:hypothetical protein DXD09_05385 [Ligilactobacillus ruminis]|uniref:Uncharacterized protein n=1 Tax=Ligilactobacillus ruminis TaxID=1623 RepID=A0A8B2YZH4_9LACO|nr:hypothetical protein DXD09_05385 [Ligilactobacillus ruminis]